MTVLALIGVPLTIVDANGDEDAGAAFALPSRTVTIGWQTSFGAVPGAVDIDLEVAMDEAGPWVGIDTSTSTAGEFRTVAVPVAARFIRANVIDSSSEDATVQIICKVAVP